LRKGAAAGAKKGGRRQAVHKPPKKGGRAISRHTGDVTASVEGPGSGTSNQNKGGVKQPKIIMRQRRE